MTHSVQIKQGVQAQHELNTYPNRVDEFVYRPKYVHEISVHISSTGKIESKFLNCPLNETLCLVRNRVRDDSIARTVRTSDGYSEVIHTRPLITHLGE